MAAFPLSAIGHFIFLPFYASLMAIGVAFLHFSVKKKAVSIEKELLERELSDQRIKQEQAKNCQSILRLLRQLQQSFAHIGKVEEEISQIKSHFQHYEPIEASGQQAQYAVIPDSVAIHQSINNRAIIQSLTIGFDIGELILRKMQTCTLDAEDKEILKTEFIRIYRQDCKRAIGCLYQLKSALPATEIIPYQLLDCAYTIELLENYFSIND